MDDPPGGSGASGAGPAVATLSLTGEAAVTQDARDLVAEVLAEAGLGRLVGDASMLVTELVTNALLHGAPPAELRVRMDRRGTARLEVSDASPAMPLRTRRNDEAMTGRGLSVVDALSARWGVRLVPPGKIVWAELRTGTTGQAQATDPEGLVGGWTELESLAGGLEPDEPRYAVRLGDIPTDLLLAAKAHVDNLVREFALASAGARSGASAPVPGHLAELIETVVHRFAAPREAIKRQALANAHAGRSHVRLELMMPASAADAGEAYLQALDQADEYCRAMRLLTLESPPQHRVFRRWYVEELVTQLRRAAAGQPPLAPQTFEQRILQEIDTVAAAQRTAERSARLSAISATLASAVTPEAVTHAVLQDGVEVLRAAGGAILLASSSSTLELPGAVGYGESVVAQLRSEPTHAELPAAMALRTGDAVWLESREERDQRFPALGGMEPTTMSICAVPLVVGDRRLGALRFSFDEARLFDGEEREFILQFAAQTAQALDRALLYAHQVDVSGRLQRSLLPPRLPDVPGMRVEAAYEPAGDGIDVGGDFYDVWQCGDGRWAFAIGDASGTGPEAAAMTALVRHTMRALTVDPAGLETVLRRLNTALLEAQADADADRFCTVLVGLLRVAPDGAEIDLVSGGHPGPLLARSSGELGFVDLGGTLLGLFDTVAALDRRTLRLSPGDEIVLYSDGVMDTRRGREFFGTDRIASTVAAAREEQRPTASALAEAVRTHAHGRVTDDVAVLTLRFTG
ncbi:MAG: SpoIIE family protein phosphatase [Egibacteraceae bacterium]